MGMLCSIPEKPQGNSTEIVAASGVIAAGNEETLDTSDANDKPATANEVGVTDGPEDLNSDPNVNKGYTMSGVFSPVIESVSLTFDSISNQNIEKLSLAEKAEYNRDISGGVTIELVPHVHTLFCERKQRVCTSIGKVQELEYLRLGGSLESIAENSIVWMRSVDASSSMFATIPNSENLKEYQLHVDDVTLFISVRYTDAATGLTVVTPAVGPILPGPPRYTKVGVKGKLWVGGYAVAEADYIGGFEGASEYWWLRIRDGVREQVRDQQACDPLSPVNVEIGSNDPRVYQLTAEDAGCILKVKIRPVRSDGFKGEIFTSMPSTTVSVHSPESNLDFSTPVGEKVVDDVVNDCNDNAI